MSEPVQQNVFNRVHWVIHDLPAIPKASRAPGNMGGYAFRGIEDITAALKPLLADHGVFMVPTVMERIESTRQTKGGGALYVVDLRVRFTFYGIEGDEFVAEMWGQGSDSGDKATQKAVTSAFKSMLAVTFCISDSELDTERHDVPETVSVPEGFASIDEAKATVDALRALVIDLDLTRWIRDQHFNWPWDKRTCDAIAAKCAIREEELAAPFEPVNEDGTPAPTLLEEKPKGKKVDTGRAAEETAAL